jgi:hypothetical protein
MLSFICRGESAMTLRRRLFLAAGLLLCSLVGLHAALSDKDQPPKRDDLIHKAIADIVQMQEKGGQWPYEGVYRVKGEIPVGYRIGGTACVADTLLFAAPDDKDAKEAVAKGLAFVLKELDDPLMAASTEDAYDVRVWGHSYALEFLCHVRAAKVAGDKADQVKEWIPKLVEILVKEELPKGGWNYASRRAPASFVTAPVTQALLLARSQGEKVPDAVFERARKVLEDGRGEDGAFAYSGAMKGREKANELPGSAARSAVCETTLVLLNGGSTDAVRATLDAFYKHWDELEKRRQKKGTHEGPYHIAPYYFYYGHRYAAQAIQMLAEKERARERERLLEVVLKTRDEDGSWNDRVFPRSKNYGTAMVLLALIGDKAPLPPALPKKEK